MGSYVQTQCDALGLYLMASDLIASHATYELVDGLSRQPQMSKDAAPVGGGVRTSRRMATCDLKRGRRCNPARHGRQATARSLADERI